MKSKALWILGILAVVVIAILVVVPLFFNANRFRPEIESRLSQALGRNVKIGDLSLSLFSGGVSASNISIADDPAFSREPFLQAKSLNVGVDMMPLLLHRQLQIESVVIKSPTVRLLQSGSGKWNVSSVGEKKQAASSGPSQAPELSVRKFEISNGTVQVGRASGRQESYTNLDLTATDVSASKAFPMHLSLSAPQGGKLKIDGQAGPLASNDPSLTPFNASVNISSFDLGATGFMSPDSGIAGVLDYDGKANSDGRRVRSEGKATASKLRLVKTGSSAAQPVSVDYHSSYDLSREAGTIDQTVIHTGKSAAQLSGTYSTRGATTDLNLHLLADKMAPSDIESLLPALGVVLPAGASLQGGSINANLIASGPADKLVTTGSINANNTKLAGFSMGKGLSSIAALAGLQAGSDTTIQLFASNLKVAPEGIRLDNINLVVPEIGSMTGDGTIGADSSLNFHLVAKLNSSGGENAVGLISSALGNKGLKSIPIHITGTTAKPVFVPDVGSAMANQLGSAAGGAQNANPVGGLLNNLFGGKKKK